jgi:hypothetical protein
MILFYPKAKKYCYLVKIRFLESFKLLALRPSILPNKLKVQT